MTPTAGPRRAPAGCILIPIALLQGIGGAVLLGASTFAGVPLWTIGLGRLVVEQGVFLCLVMSAGSMLSPSIAETPRPVLLYAAAGAAILASLILEQLGWQLAGPLVRAGVLVAAFGYGTGAWRLPAAPAAYRRLVWLSMWLMPVGLVLSACLSDLRVAALHILFIGGFGLLAFAAATHVVLGHLSLEQSGQRRSVAVVVMGVAFVLALCGRLAADVSHTYFDHLAWSAGVWIVGSAVWLGYFGWTLLRRNGPL